MTYDGPWERDQMTADEIRERKKTGAPVWIVLEGDIKQGSLGKPDTTPGQDRLVTQYVQVDLDKVFGTQAEANALGLAGR